MKYFVTTAIDYTNSGPHIGHAYEKVLADVITRYHRLVRGAENAFLLTGVDQHGQKVQQAARRQNVEPMQFAQQNTDQFLRLWELLEIRKDGWAATTDPRHKRAVQKVLDALLAKDELYKATYTGYYSIRQEQFLTDKERNEQGEFGPEWGEVAHIEEENWYFRLSKHKAWLRRYVESHPEFVTPAFRHAELLNAIDRLSDDLCVSRPKERLSWGIEFPFDPDYVTYVWFDALLNYVTFAGYLAEPGSGLPDFRELWPCQAHVIGKDILVPAHGIYWPVMLHAMGFADDQMPKLLVHGWWNVAGAKMSKSLGNVIDPFDVIQRYGADALRFYLMRDIVTGQDADISLERLLVRYNADLANDLGNLVNRTINMGQRYRRGRLAKPGELDPALKSLVDLSATVIERYHTAFQQYMVHAALEAAWELVNEANAVVERKAPWKLAKAPERAAELDSVLYALAETCRLLAKLVEPVVPGASQRILTQLGAGQIGELSWGALADGHQLGTPSPIFPRV
ncbi:MAG: methionine--tRNA ligase, partial [Verrucomicrobia bacterium]|nr:methionine--tRNA ligase [Verrucomicrobiota bacterium]